MTQLVVRTFDPEAGAAMPAYAVCVAQGRAFARALSEKWAPTAERVQAGLNLERPWERGGACPDGPRRGARTPAQAIAPGPGNGGERR